jgi:hypothetical protein
VDDVRDLIRGILAECPLCNENTVRVSCVSDYHPRGCYTSFHIWLQCLNCDWVNSGTIEVSDILFDSHVRAFDAFKGMLEKFLTLENAFADIEDDLPEELPEVDVPKIDLAKISKVLKEEWSTDAWPKSPPKEYPLADTLRQEGRDYLESLRRQDRLETTDYNKYLAHHYPPYSITTTNTTNGTNYSAKRKRARKS